MAAKVIQMPHIVPEQRIELDGATLTVRPRRLPHYQAAMQWARKHNRETTGTLASCSKATSWHGNVTNHDYEKMLTKGWPEGIVGVRGLDGLASDAVERLVFEREVGGAFPVVPAYLAGDPQSMLMPRVQSNDNARGLTLVIDSAFECGVGGRTVLQYAQRVMQLVAWLEAERIECAVYSISCAVYADDGRVAYLTPIREAGQILQPERIASIVHPAFLRRAHFSMLEYDTLVGGANNGRMPWGYGRPSHPSIAELQRMLPETGSVIMLPKVGDGDPTKAVEESLNLKLKRD